MRCVAKKAHTNISVLFLFYKIQTHGHVLCGQESTHEHQCVIYTNQNYADFSLLYLKNY